MDRAVRDVVEGGEAARAQVGVDERAAVSQGAPDVGCEDVQATPDQLVVERVEHRAFLFLRSSVQVDHTGCGFVGGAPRRPVVPAVQGQPVPRGQAHGDGAYRWAARRDGVLVLGGPGGAQQGHAFVGPPDARPALRSGQREQQAPGTGCGDARDDLVGQVQRPCRARVVRGPLRRVGGPPRREGLDEFQLARASHVPRERGGAAVVSQRQEFEVASRALRRDRHRVRRAVGVQPHREECRVLAVVVAAQPQRPPVPGEPADPRVAVGDRHVEGGHRVGRAQDDRLAPSARPPAQQREAAVMAEVARAQGGGVGLGDEQDGRGQAVGVDQVDRQAAVRSSGRGRGAGRRPVRRRPRGGVVRGRAEERGVTVPVRPVGRRTRRGEPVVRRAGVRQGLPRETPVRGGRSRDGDGDGRAVVRPAAQVGGAGRVGPRQEAAAGAVGPHAEHP